MKSFMLLLIIGSITLLTLGCAQEEEKSAKNGEELYNAKCLSCHPDDSKFADYKGKSADLWKDGIQVMIDKGRVQLSEEEINLIASYLEEKYRE